MVLTVDQLPLEILLGKARVVELQSRDRVDRPDLEALDLRDDLRILFKTRMAGQMLKPEFQDDHVYLTEDAATYLVQAGIKLVGFDYLSFEKPGSLDFPAHHALLSLRCRDRGGPRPVGGRAGGVRPRLPAPAHRGRRRAPARVLLRNRANPAAPTSAPGFGCSRPPVR